MEDAERAIKRVRDELAVKDKANGTSVAESLDLADLVKKIDRGVFDAPPEVLGSIKTSWAKARKDAATHAPSSRGTRHSNRNPESDLADAVIHVQQCWLEEGLKGTVLDESDYAMHASKINFIAVKTALNAAGNWSQRNVWDGFLPRLKSIKEDVALKTEGPYRTYAQLIRSLETIIADCKAEVLDARRKGRSVPDPEEMEEAAGFVKDLTRWLWGKWGENTLPRYDVGGGDGDVGSPGAGGRRSRGVKRGRYTEEDSDGSFDSDSDDSDGDSDGDDKNTNKRVSEPVVKKKRGRPPKSSYASPAPGGGSGPASGPLSPKPAALPPGATQSPTDTDVVIVKVTCHGLQATVELVRPRVPEKPRPADPSERPELAMKATKAPRSESPRLPSGPPCGARVLAVAGVAVNADTDPALASPAAFEAHARTVAGESAAADGGGDENEKSQEKPSSAALDFADDDDAKFRECARVIERDGVDVPLVEYEAKLATAPFPTSLNALPKSPRAAGGVAGVVGCSTGTRGKDAKDQLAAAHKRALLPAGTTRAAELRVRLKDLRGKIDDVMRDVSAGSEDCGRFGASGKEVRRSSAATNSAGDGGSEYVTYNKKVDEAIVLGGRWANAVAW